MRSRIGVRVVNARDLAEALPDCFVKFTVGRNKLKSNVVRGGGSELVFDFVGSVEVPGTVTEITCQLKHYHTQQRFCGICAKARKRYRTFRGRGAGASHVLGQVTLALGHMKHVNVSSDDGTNPASEPGSDYDGEAVNEIDYPLVGSHGEHTSLVMRLQIIVVSTSRAPKPLTSLIGTWNVGNALPDQNLASWQQWLPTHKIAEADLIAIGAQVHNPKEKEKNIFVPNNDHGISIPYCFDSTNPTIHTISIA